MKNTLTTCAVIFIIGFVTVPAAWSDDDDYRRGMEAYPQRSAGAVTASAEVYREECGSCHMAYSPRLLPAASWMKIMSGLDKHFGDNAELDAETEKTITGVLLMYSADRSDYRRARRYNSPMQYNDAPVRITQMPGFRRAHHEIPGRMVTGNPEVKSFSRCNACHLRAEQGSFNEHDVRIPGYGRWEDD
jgi:hypothetical protein